MKTLTETQYTGRKAHIGKICFDETGRIQVFVNYCDNCNGKCVLTIDEARDFSNKYRTEEQKTSSKIFERFLKNRSL